MKKFISTIINGYIGLMFPLIVTVILLQKLHHLIYPLVLNIEEKLHISRFLGVISIVVISAVLMIFIGYLAGLLIKTPFVKKLVEKFENEILSKIPIYNLLKSLIDTEIGAKGNNKFLPALLKDGDSFSLCYVTSESEDYFSVFISEGGLSGGELRIVPKDTVRLLNVGLNEFTRIIKQYGVNSAQYAETFFPHGDQTKNL